MKRWMVLALVALLIPNLAHAAYQSLGHLEDDATANQDVLVGIGCEREDTPSTDTTASLDWSHVKCDSKGQLWVNIAAITSALPTGANTIGTVNLGTGGTGATSLGKAQGGAALAGDTAPAIQCIRHDTSTTGLGANGTYNPCSLNANGHLYTVDDTELPAASTLADATANPSLPAVAAYLMAFNGTTWDRARPGVTDSDDASIATAQSTALILNLPYAYDGANWVRPRMDPCADGNKLYVPISQTASAQLLAGTASKRTFVCSVNVVTATAQNIALVSGTGSVCGTGTHAMAGGTTAGTGWNFAANGGIVVGTSVATIAKSTTDADNVCLLQSGVGQVSGTLSYVAATN